MSTGPLTFSLNEIRVEGEDEFDVAFFDSISDSDTEDYKIDEEIVAVKKSEKNLFANRFVFLEFNNGEKLPYTETVYDSVQQVEVHNPRESNLIELKEQTLVLIDCEKQEIYLSNQNKHKEIQKWLSTKLKKEVAIKLLMNEDNFMQKITSLKSVSLTAESSAYTEGDLTLPQRLSRDAYGYGAKTATLTLSYKKDFPTSTKDKIAEILGRKDEFKKVSLCGRTAENFEAVFNTDYIVYKVVMDSKRDAINGKFNAVDALTSLSLKIQKNEL